MAWTRGSRTRTAAPHGKPPPLCDLLIKRWFFVRALFAPAANVGTFTGSFNATVGGHDIGVFKLTPGAC